MACTTRSSEVASSGAGKDGEKQLTRLEEAFGKLSTSIEHLKREKEEMQARYYKHSIPFDFASIKGVQERSIAFAKLHMAITLALVDAPKLLAYQEMQQVPAHWQSLLKKCFEFAFKVQQFANVTDDAATKLFEDIFAVIEKLHQIQKSSIQATKAAATAAAATVATAAAAAP